MKALLTTLIMCLALGAQGQTYQQLIKQKDSLKSLIVMHQTMIEEIDKATADMLSKAYQNRNSTAKESYLKAVTYRRVPVFEAPVHVSKQLFHIEKGDTVDIYDYDWFNGFIIINLDTAVGFVPEYSFEPTNELKDYMATVKKIKKEQEEKEREERIARNEATAKANRTAKLKSKYAGQTLKDIVEYKIWIGMTDKMTRDSWGEPDRINSSINSYKVREQWVYSSAYLYFEDGVLKSYQTTR